jgi:Arc/MetJ-type ribon-helix-helix transcriptional regulator
MGNIEINLPPRTEDKIARLVEAGEYDSLEHAAEELIQSGLMAHQTGNEPNTEEPIDEGIASSHHDDEYMF